MHCGGGGGDVVLCFVLTLFILIQVPDEEKNLGPNDRLIHVYHFTKESAQNQMVLKFPF